MSVPVAMLARRKPFQWDYSAQPKEHVEECNACGSKLWVTLAQHDRYGFPAMSHCCHSCGLIFLSPRMTKEAYAEFYKSTYRNLIEWYTPGSAPAGEESQTRYAKKIIPLLKPYVSKQADSLLDIGGAPGVCAEIVGAVFGCSTTIVDPASESGAKGGSDFFGTPIEGLSTSRKWGIILCCQTVDHLLDLRGSLEKMRSLLSDDGVLWVDILDWLYSLRQTRSVEACAKIDHPYGLTERHFFNLLLSVGLSPQRLSYQGRHIGFVCKKTHPRTRPFSEYVSKGEVLAEVRKIEAEGKWSSARGR